MRNAKTKRNLTIAMFAVAIIILQTISTFINFGFPITLSLIPIVLAGAIYGPGVGSLMGTVFGVIVALMVATGADPSGAAMLAIHPVITLSVCVVKGAACGFVGALAYKLLKNKNQMVAIAMAAALTPITNTAILFLCLIAFFESTFAAMMGAFMSINFLIELCTDVVIAPGLLGLINKYSK